MLVNFWFGGVISDRERDNGQRDVDRDRKRASHFVGSWLRILGIDY